MALKPGGLSKWSPETVLYHKIFMEAVQETNDCVLESSNITFLANTQELLRGQITTKNMISCFLLISGKSNI